jgi:hypothetical protein
VRSLKLLGTVVVEEEKEGVVADDRTRGLSKSSTEEPAADAGG